MEQTLYDEIINFVLQSVSSEEYLNDDVGIYRPETMSLSEFKKIKKKDRKPGIYPIDAGNNSVHYIGVNKQKKAGNGYLDNLGIQNSVGMDAQINHGHGLCQTFALMYHLGEDNLIRRVNCGGYLPPLTSPNFPKCFSDYVYNVVIGLEFLQDFTRTYDMEWAFTTLNNKIEKKYKGRDHDTKLKEIMENAVHRITPDSRKIKYYSLHLMIKNILLDKNNENNLINWHTS